MPVVRSPHRYRWTLRGYRWLLDGGCSGAPHLLFWLIWDLGYILVYVAVLPVPRFVRLDSYCFS